MIFLQNLLNERVTECVASDPHDFTAPHQAPFRRVFIICRSITNIVLPPVQWTVFLVQFSYEDKKIAGKNHNVQKITVLLSSHVASSRDPFLLNCLGAYLASHPLSIFINCNALGFFAFQSLQYCYWGIYQKVLKLTNPWILVFLIKSYATLIQNNLNLNPLMNYNSRSLLYFSTQLTTTQSGVK